MLLLGLLLLLLFWLTPYLGWPGVGLTVWCYYFFRDPERVTPLDDDLVISPADGRVSSIVQVRPPQELGLGDGEMLRLSPAFCIGAALKAPAFDFALNSGPAGQSPRPPLRTA